MSYIFGGNTGLTYDQIQRRRQLAQAMMQSGMKATPQTAVQGLNAAAQSIVGAILDKRYGKKEQAQRDAYNQQFQSAFGGLGAPAKATPAAYQPAPVTTTAIDKPDPTDPANIASDTMTALGVAPQKVGRDFFVNGLIQRGLPPHVAQGIAMNIGDESGFNPSAVGDNGNALGAAQWNGPRMEALKQFAAAQGKPATDPNVQMDFMVHELQGPESGAMKAMLGTTTPGQAAAAFLNQYERPAEVNRTRREAAYLGAQPQATLSTAGQPEMAPQAQPHNMDFAQLAALASSPYATSEQKAMISALMQQQMQANDPLRQAQLAKLQAETHKLQDPNAAGRFGLNLIYGKDAQGNIVALQPNSSGGVRQIDLPQGVTLQPGVQKIDLGTAWGILDRSGNVVSTVPKDLRGEASDKAVGKTEGTTIGNARAMLPQQEQNVGLVNQQIDDLINDPYLDHMLGPIDSRLPNVTSDAARVQAKMDQIQGQAFMAARQMLKGGGQITDYEGQRAEKAYLRMQSAQTPGDFKQALTDFKNAVNEGLTKLKRQAQVSGNDAGITTPPPAPADGTKKPTMRFNPATGKLEPVQ